MSKKEKNEREIWVGENRIYLSDDDILFVIAVGEQTDEKVFAQRDAINKLIEEVEGKVNLIVNADKSGKASSKARKVFQEISEDKRIGKIAILGTHPVARVLASFVMGISKKKDMRFFGSKEEAMAWLKE